MMGTAIMILNGHEIEDENDELAMFSARELLEAEGEEQEEVENHVLVAVKEEVADISNDTPIIDTHYILFLIHKRCWLSNSLKMASVVEATIQKAQETEAEADQDAADEAETFTDNGSSCSNNTHNSRIVVHIIAVTTRLFIS